MAQNGGHSFRDRASARREPRRTTHLGEGVHDGPVVVPRELGPALDADRRPPAPDEARAAAGPLAAGVGDVGEGVHAARAPRGGVGDVVEAQLHRGAGASSLAWRCGGATGSEGQAGDAGGRGRPGASPPWKQMR